MIAEVEHQWSPAAVWQRACSRESASCGASLSPSTSIRDQGASTVTRSGLAVVAFEVDRGGKPLLHVLPGEAAILLDGRDCGSPSSPGRRSNPAWLRTTPQRLRPRAHADPANGSVTRPPVGEVARLCEQRPDVVGRRQQFRCGLHSHAGDCHDSGAKASPTRAEFLVTLALGRRLGVPETRGEPAREAREPRRARSGQAEDLEHTRAEQVDRLAQLRGDQDRDDERSHPRDGKRQERPQADLPADEPRDPFASMRISPTFKRVRNVDDIPDRLRSRNSITLKCVPTATISSAPFSCASRSARSSLMPIVGTAWYLRPRRSMRSAPGASPPG